jgi:hypothetical protein
MHIDQMSESKFLKQSDVGEGMLVTIKGLKRTNVAKEDEEPENKYCLHFNETEKPLVLNKTNIQLCALACGSQQTDDWVGKQIVLFNDPTVAYAGKLVGGIRIRARKGAAKPAQSDPYADLADGKVARDKPTFTAEDDDLGNPPF